MTDDEPRIRVKAMVVALSADGLTHAVSVCPPSAENPSGYHRLIGGGVEVGETHRQAVAGRSTRSSAPRSPTSPTLVESDGTRVPVHWRPLADAAETAPLYPSGAIALVAGARPEGPARA